VSVLFKVEIDTITSDNSDMEAYLQLIEVLKEATLSGYL